MTLMGRAGQLIDQAKAKVQEYESDDPHTAGRVRQVVGGVLIAEGLVGLENPFDGEKSRPGILGAFIGIFAGIAVCVLGIFMYTQAPDVDAVAQGQVTSVSETTRKDDNGNRKTECSLSASFEAGGRTYTTSSGRSKDNCQYSEGSTIEVHYESGDPSQNYVGHSPKKAAVFWAIGGILSAVVSFVTFLLRAASIWFGWKLFRSGRRMVKDNPKPAGSGEDRTVAEVKEKFTAALMKARGGGIGGLISSVTGKR